MLAPLGNPLIVTMGMGQEEATEPGMIAAGIIEYFKFVVQEIKEALRGDGADPYFDDDIDIYKITAMLNEVNSSPLSNPLYNKISRLVFEKKIKIKAEIDENVSSTTQPLRVLVGSYKVTREPGG